MSTTVNCCSSGEGRGRFGGEGRHESACWRRPRQAGGEVVREEDWWPCSGAVRCRPVERRHDGEGGVVEREEGG